MIGITLVSFISLFGRSLRDADDHAWRSQVTADYVVTSQNGWDAFSTCRRRRGAQACRACERDLARARRPRPRRLGERRASTASIRRRSSGWSRRRRRASPRVAARQRARSSRTASRRRTASASATRSRSAVPTGSATRLKAVGIFTAPKLDSLLSAIVVPNDAFDRALPRPRDQLRVRQRRRRRERRGDDGAEGELCADQIVKVETRDGFAARASRSGSRRS